MTSSGGRLRRGDPDVRFRNPRERALWILALAACPAIAWAIAQVLQWPVGVRAVLAGLAAMAIAVIPEIRARRGRVDKAAKDLASLRVPAVAQRLPLVKDVELRDLGVHSSIRQVDYVPRDAEREINKNLAAKIPVLLVGHSMSGKTRLAAQSIKAIYPLTPLLAPQTSGSLRTLLDDGLVTMGTVVWFDDLEKFLKGESGMDVALLRRMKADGAVIVATIRRNELNAFRPSNDDRPSQWDVIGDFTLVSLARRLTTSEKHLARDQIHDKAVLDGIDRYGLAEYLGAGPQAIGRFDDGEISNPVGYALVRAAVDWRRAGLARQIPREDLQSAMTFYLADRPEVRTDAKAVDDGFDWATRPINETVALLGVREDRGGTPPEPLVKYEAFDYIVDVVVNRSRSDDGAGFAIPAGMWDAVRRAASPAEVPDVSRAAFRYYFERPGLVRTAQEWLTSSDPGRGGLLVTGGPGSGKSAFLYHLREVLPKIYPELIESVHAFSVLGKGVSELRRELAIRVGLAPPDRGIDVPFRRNALFAEMLAKSVAGTGRERLIMLDGIDESVEQVALWDFVLALADYGTGGLRVICSSRRWGLPSASMLSDWVVIDLDADRNGLREDVFAWVMQILQAPGSPIADDVALSQELATRVVSASDGSFLTARIMVELIVAYGPSVDLETLDAFFSRGVTGQIDMWLDRLGPDRNQGLAVLRLVARAQRPLRLRELVEDLVGSGTDLEGEQQLERIFSGLSTLLNVVPLPGGDKEVGLKHAAIRDALR